MTQIICFPWSLKPILDSRFYYMQSSRFYSPIIFVEFYHSTDIFTPSFAPSASPLNEFGRAYHWNDSHVVLVLDSSFFKDVVKVIKSNFTSFVISLTRNPLGSSGVSVMPKWEFFRFRDTFWKALSAVHRHLSKKRYALWYVILQADVSLGDFSLCVCEWVDLSFSHLDSLLSNWNSVPLPQCICKCLPFCYWVDRPKAHQPASCVTKKITENLPIT